MRTTALPAAGPVRPRTLMVGSLFGSSAVVVGFLALVSIYVQQRQQVRSAGEEWFPSGSIEMGPAGMMMVTLLLASITAQWAVQAARADDRPHGWMALGTTLLFGTAVIVQFSFVFQSTGFEIDAGVAQLLFYAVTGSFVVILVAAMAFIAVTVLRSLIGPLDSDRGHAVQAAALFWHATVFCYFLVWYVVFITK